jgi:decaprenylphospho-beta-D-erythro-pentofuranosid-2-ulose 2-reductase
MRDGTGRFQTVLVLGGGSEIARATLHRFLDDGPLTIALAARRPAELETADLERRGATVERFEFDARARDSHQGFVERVFDRRADVDLVMLAFGVLGSQQRAEHDSTAAAEVVETNFTGAVSVLTAVAERLQEQGHGAIVVLSSVAAERARRSNYVYGASKAGLDTFAQGLQLALAPFGIGVLIVRPGFVRTQLTRGLRPAPLSVRPEAVGEAIAAALKRQDDLIWVPASLRAVMWAIRRLPKRALRAL